MMAVEKTVESKYLVLQWEEFVQQNYLLFKMVHDSGYRPDILLGISRGGLVPLRIFADLATSLWPNVEITSIRIKFYKGIAERQSVPIIVQDVGYPIREKKLLVLDDVADTGQSLKTAKEYLQFKGPKEIRTATVFYKPWSIIKPDYHVLETDKWIVFSHEYQEFMSQIMKETRYTEDEARQLFDSIKMPKWAQDFFFERIYHLLKKEQHF